jgi:hypothetical protein
MTETTALLDDLICPACKECADFTLHQGGPTELTPATVRARCQNCRHEITLQRYAPTWTEPVP